MLACGQLACMQTANTGGCCALLSQAPMLEADDRFAAEGVAKLVHGILKLGVIDYNIRRGTMRRNRHM
jgi:hypothetical protein